RLALESGFCQGTIVRGCPRRAVGRAGGPAPFGRGARILLRRIARRRRQSLAMNITRILSVPALLLLAGQAAASPNVQSTRLYLTRPEIGAPDLDATGSVLIRSYDGGDRERFDVRAHKITIKATVELWIDDGTGTMAFVANLVGNKGKKYSVD